MSDEPTDTKLVPGASPDPASPDHAPEKTATDARAGVTSGSERSMIRGRIRLVLHTSIGLAILALIIVWAISAHA